MKLTASYEAYFLLDASNIHGVPSKSVILPHDLREETFRRCKEYRATNNDALFSEEDMIGWCYIHLQTRWTIHVETCECRFNDRFTSVACPIVLITFETDVDEIAFRLRWLGS